MLIAKNMLEAFTKNNTTGEYNNNDADFGQVLEFCGDTAVYNHKIRYSDGQERNFSFEN